MKNIYLIWINGDWNFFTKKVKWWAKPFMFISLMTCSAILFLIYIFECVVEKSIKK